MTDGVEHRQETIKEAAYAKIAITTVENAVMVI